MKISSIASGSTGNCIYLNSNNTNIIIDAGISKKRIEEGLNKNNTSLSEIDAIFITHEHVDHIKGLGVVSRKYNIPMYGTKQTLFAVKKSTSLGTIDEELFNFIEPDEFFILKDMKIKPFRTSHDAANPVAYRVEDSKKSVAVVTDLGKYDDYIISNLKGLDTIFIEANHDVNMLHVGTYPYYIKQRILSEIGHLSNELSGKLLCELLHDGLKNIILGHISKENNYEALAYETVKSEISIGENKYKGEDFPIFTAKYNEVTSAIEF